MLAGLIRSPARYSPHDRSCGREGAARPGAREDARAGLSSRHPRRRQARGAKVETVPPKDVPAVAPYFVEYVKQDLLARLGADAVFNGGLRVHTTLDRVAAGARPRSAARGVLGEAGDPDVALVTLEPETGRILAMVGGRDFSTRPVQPRGAGEAAAGIGVQAVRARDRAARRA